MTVRRLAIFLSIVAISLFAFNAYNRPSQAASICVDGSYTPSKIISACTELIESSDATPSQMVSYLNHRSWAFKRDGDLEAAIFDLDSILEIEPAYLNAWINKAYYHDDLGDIDAAAEDFAAALALEPNNTSTLMRRAKMSYLRGDYELAQQDYERVLRLVPRHLKAIINIANIHINNGNYDVAIDWLNEWALKLPNEPDIFETLGSLYLLHRRDFGGSIEAFLKLFELRPEYENTLLWLGSTHILLGDEEVGIQYIERFSEKLVEKNGLGEAPFRGMVLNAAQYVLIGDRAQFLVRGTIYGGLSRSELAWIEFERFVVEGGDIAIQLLRDVLKAHHYCNNPDCGTDIDGNFGTAINAYISDLEGLITLKNYHPP